MYINLTDLHVFQLHNIDVTLVYELYKNIFYMT
jgi:hypothetical protein